MRVLTTGGAGYVGSVVTEELVRQQHEVVVLDNLQQGHRSAVADGAELIVADICNDNDLDDVFERFSFDAVVHLAADTVVGESVAKPAPFFETNVSGGVKLLGAMVRHDVRRIVYSSSAAVYGEPSRIPIQESDDKVPSNPYGTSKLMFEQMLAWYGGAYNIRHVSLRYFNAAGAGEHCGEDHNPETHLIPNVLKVALGQVQSLQIFGSDYITKDGSCVRDYVHVRDIAQAHILALSRMDELSGRAYNLGNTEGYTNLEIVKVAEQVTGRDIPVKMGPRRLGDPTVLLASSEMARTELGWNPRFPELKSMMDDAWQWIQRNPSGYDD